MALHDILKELQAVPAEHNQRLIRNMAAFFSSPPGAPIKEGLGADGTSRT